ncbi:hypothetical protein BREVNS_0217 [Brevinematales bacterium NS]|nr:hypothetical protein BREVNS_0217 [Brevinematales bacterium NS]
MVFCDGVKKQASAKSAQERVKHPPIWSLYEEISCVSR